MWNGRVGLGVAAVAAVLLAGIKINHAINYQSVEAQVVSIQSECHFEDKTFLVVASRTQTSREDWPCTEIKQVQASIPEFADWTIKGDVKIAFDYVSPADQQQHQGKLTFAYADNPDYADKSRGDTVAILAHGSDPASYADPN